MTEQEKLLVLLAVKHPKQALQWNTLAQNETMPLVAAPLFFSKIGTQPMRLEAINIAPLPSVEDE